MKRRCVTEDNLVKTQRGLRTIITAVALLVACAPAFAQPPMPGLEPIPASPSIAPAPNGAVQPAPAAQAYPNTGWETPQPTNGESWQQEEGVARMYPTPMDAAPEGVACPVSADSGMEPCVDYLCQEEDCCPPAWYLRQGTRIMHRSTPRGIQMTQEAYSQRIEELSGITWRVISSSTGYTPIFNTKMIKFDVDAGYDVTLGHYLGRDSRNRDHFIEFTYYGLNNWVENRDIRANQRTEVSNFTTENDLGIPVNRRQSTTFGLLYSYTPSKLVFNADQGTLRQSFVPSTGFAEDIAGFNRAQQHWISYESQWDNFEFNLRVKPRERAKDRLVLYPNGRWRRECQEGWRPEYLLGLRGFSFDEWFYFAGRNRDYGTAGDYRIRTHNDSFGFQIGMDLKYRYRRLDWGFKTRVAPVLNFAEQISQLSANTSAAEQVDYPDAVGLPFRSWSATKDKAACVLELGVGADYHIYPNMKLYAGYDMMWVTGLALAPEQISWNPETAPWISAGGKAFFQSLNLGAELVW